MERNANAKGQAQKQNKTNMENWNNHKVYTVSVEDVECVEFEHYPNPPKGATKAFQLNSEQFSATIDFPLTSHKKGVRIKLGNSRWRSCLLIAIL